MNPAATPLAEALAEVKDLERALASSQAASNAAREHVELLIEANARLRELAARHEVAKARHPSPRVDRECMSDREAPPGLHTQTEDPAKPALRRMGTNLPALDGFEPTGDRLWAVGEEGMLPRPPIRARPHIQGSDIDCHHGEDDARSLSHDEARRAVPSWPWRPMDFCLLAGLEADASPHIERMLTERIRFPKGGVLYRAGGWFHALYAIRSGSAKTVLLAKDGQDQVAGYHMAGDIIGIDGIGSDIHECQAIALEDMEACPLPFDQLENLARLSNQFRRNLQKLLSQENARARTLMLVLATMRAEKRLAIFLLDLSQRYRARGYSSCEFVLRMTREEIGSYLGLKLETVSRLFSRFQREGLIRVDGRAVKLLDRGAMNQLLEGGA